jgi:hypothetical protein
MIPPRIVPKIVQPQKAVGLHDLLEHPRNPNKHTAAGDALLEKSFQNCGAGRSILIDKAGRIIAGNGARKAAAKAGVKLRIVETDGTELIAVRRRDLDLEDPKDPRARVLAILDNKTNEVGLEWNREAVAAVAEEVGVEEVGFTAEELTVEEGSGSASGQSGGSVNFTARYKVMVAVEMKTSKG